MDGFSYYNIFDTKGIEYLIVIAFLLLLIPFWSLLNRPVKKAWKLIPRKGILPEQLRLPGGLFFSKNHSWAFMERSGHARIGLDELLVHLTGPVEVNHLKTVGEYIRKGDPVASVRQNGKSLLMRSPLSGRLVQNNPEISRNPEYLYSDPYGEGWLLELSPAKWTDEIRSLQNAETAREWAHRELTRFRDFIASSIRQYVPGRQVLVLQEGGEIVDFPLSAMPEGVWRDFQAEFMDELD
jgi:glycine cleavage system H protein